MTDSMDCQDKEMLDELRLWEYRGKQNINYIPFD